jgi:hypothetical protein
MYFEWQVESLSVSFICDATHTPSYLPLIIPKFRRTCWFLQYVREISFTAKRESFFYVTVYISGLQTTSSPTERNSEWIQYAMIP